MDTFPNQFPDKQLKEIDLVMIGFMLIQNGYVINKIWVFLDICYIDSMKNSLYYVEDFNNCAKHKELTVLTNVRSLPFDQKG